MAGIKQEVRIPRQQRSIEKKQRIKAAAEKLFAEKGFYPVNSNQIALAAGVSVGSFYSYFKDKKALLLEIITEFHQRFQTEVFSQPMEKGWKDWDLKEIIRYYINNTLKAFELSPDFFRMIYSMLYYDPEVKEVFDAAEKKEREQIKSILSNLKRRICVQDIDAAVFMIYSSIANVVHRLKLLGLQMEEERLISELTTMLYRYLKKDTI